MGINQEKKFAIYDIDNPRRVAEARRLLMGANQSVTDMFGSDESIFSGLLDQYSALVDKGSNNPVLEFPKGLSLSVDQEMLKLLFGMTLCLMDVIDIHLGNTPSEIEETLSRMRVINRHIGYGIDVSPGQVWVHATCPLVSGLRKDFDWANEALHQKLGVLAHGFMQVGRIPGPLEVLTNTQDRVLQQRISDRGAEK